jgi:hypothetical protein
MLEGGMLFRKMMTIALFPALFLLVVVSVGAPAREGITELEFGASQVSDLDVFRTMKSLVKVSDGLYLMTHHGDCEELFQRENQALIDHPFINDRSRHCSVFSAATEDSVLMGRNWDNENVGSIIVTLYNPPRGYSSISFSRSIELGFGKGIDLEQIGSPEIGRRLLLTPFYATDGINEHGLAVAVAGDQESTVKSKKDKGLIFISFLIRKILDQTKNIEEAVRLAEGYVPFLLDKDTLVAHLLIVDSSGRSVVLEYVEDEWRTTFGEKPWQVMSTKRIFNVSDAEMREKCRRFAKMSETLEKTEGDMGWEACMSILQDVSQKGTTWSVVYSPTAKDLHFSVYQKWDDIYHLRLP